VALVLVAGAAFRLAYFGLNPSLTVDDAMLSVNIVARSWAGLTHRLAFQQTAPLGFLWVLRASVLIGGVNEFALRAIPVLAGALLPYALWRLARRVLSAGAALLAAAFAALSPILIQYSISAKPYETDALATIAISLAGLAVLDNPTRRRWAGLGAVGAVAICFSTPAVFILAGCWITLVIAGRREWLPLSLTAAAWAGLFALLYFTMLRREASSAYMQSFWDHRFFAPAALVTDPWRGWDIVKRLPTQAFTGDTASQGGLLLCWVAALAGLVQLRRHGVARLLLLVAPFVVVFGASALRRYPVSPRLFVFAAPLVLLVVAAGAELAWERLNRGVPGLLVRALVAVWLAVLVVLSLNISRLWAQPTREVVAALGPQQHPGEPLYLYPGAVPAWLYYATDWRDPADTAQAAEIEAAERLDGNAFHNRLGRGRAVADTEGTHLVWMHHGRPVLLGLSTGIAWREGQWFSQEAPDTGWAEREAARIDAATDSTAWLMFANVYRREVFLLTHALAERRAVVVSSENNRGAMLYRVRFTR
jgi:4-amino-4-deoxy-L-arabinose transferase-like glycosyltransferase